MATVLHVQAARKKLGLQSDQALYQKVHRHQVPFRRWGGSLIFLEDELEMFLQNLPGVTLEHLQTGHLTGNDGMK